MRSHYVSILKAKTVGLVSSTQEKLLQQVQETYYSQQYQNSQSKLFALNNNGFQKNIMLENSLRISGVPSFTAPPIVEQEQKQGTWWEKIIIVPTKLTNFFGGFYEPIATNIHANNHSELVDAANQEYSIPNFGETADGKITISNSENYHAPPAGPRRMNESTILSRDDMLGKAFRKVKELAEQDNLIKNGIKKVGDTIKKVGTSLTVLSIGIEAGIGVYENVSNGESWERIAGDAVGDVVVSGGIELGSAAIGGFLGGVIGSVVPVLGTGVGAAIGAGLGFIAGELASLVVDNVNIKGKTFHEHTQDFTTSFFADYRPPEIDPYTGLTLRGFLS